METAQCLSAIRTNMQKVVVGKDNIIDLLFPCTSRVTRRYK